MCRKKLQLLMKYSKALMAHANAVRVWAAKANVGGGGEELESLKEAAKEARDAAEDARHELETHIEHHGC